MSIKEEFLGKLLGLGMMNHLRGGPGPRNIPDPLTEAEVIEFEKKTGTPLPDDYRSFLLEIGGCSLVTTMVRPVEGETFHSVGTEFTMFFGGKADRDSLWAYYDLGKEYLPDSVVPIGTNLFGDFFCLRITAPERGNVLYFDQDDGKLYLFGRSFRDFLKRLERNPGY